VARRTPAGRDLIGPYAEALRGQGLTVALYYSHADWNHPDYASAVHPQPPDKEVRTNSYASARPGTEDPAAWAR
jgi:alpha-L-fucosidase